MADESESKLSRPKPNAGKKTKKYYKVESILGSRIMMEGDLWYLVKWQDYPGE